MVYIGYNTYRPSRSSVMERRKTGKASQSLTKVHQLDYIFNWWSKPNLDHLIPETLSSRNNPYVVFHLLYGKRLLGTWYIACRKVWFLLLTVPETVQWSYSEEKMVQFCVEYRALNSTKPIHLVVRAGPKFS